MSLKILQPMKLSLVKRQIRQFIDNLLSRPQELYAFLVSSWVLRFGSRSISLTPKSALVFSPHQDDETFGCGGMIALKRKQNIPVSVIFLTDGQKSHTYAPWLEAPKNIVEIRRQEALDALSILGVDSSCIHFLDQVDGSLRDLSREQYQSLVHQIAQLLLCYQPEEVYVPHCNDNHPDHEFTYQLVASAIAQTQIQVELLQYPIWLFWELLIFFDLKLHYLRNAIRLPIREAQDQKKQAISVYRSQHPLLPPGFLKNYLTPYEIFFNANSLDRTKQL